MGSAETCMIELLERLDRNRFYPIVLCPGTGPFSDLCRQKGIRVEYLKGIPNLGGHPLDFARVIIPNTLAISRLIQKLDIRLVHSNWWRVAYYSGLAARICHVPSITHVRDYFESFRAGIKYFLLGAVSDRLIPVSNAVQDSILSHVPSLASKTRVIYDGIPQPQQFRPEQIRGIRREFGMQDRFPLLAIVGSFSPLKGQAVALKAMPQILANYPYARLLLVGEPYSEVQESYRKELLILMHQLGIESHVNFTGFRSDAQLIMAGVDVLIHPATLPDAFPRVLLEGSAQKALIVASQIGGVGEIIQDGATGLLVQPGDPKNLANSLINILNDPLKSQTMREAAYRRVTEKFSIDNNVSEIQHLYEEVMGGSN